MFLKISTLVLIPALIIQGHQVKKNILRLAEPDGSREGVVGAGKALSVLILGDSAAAGVGVKMQEQALLGSVLRELMTDYEVYYNLSST